MSDVKTVTVSTSMGEVVVHKLAFGDLAHALRAFQALPTEVVTFIQGTPEESLKDKTKLMSALLPILADSFEDIAGIIAIATDKDRSFIAKAALPDALDIVDAALELNDFSRVVATIKKIMARKQATQTPETANAETEKSQ